MTRLVTSFLLTVLVMTSASCLGSGAVTITEDDGGSTIEMAAEQTLELRIRANPTTGYEWVVLEPGVLELTSRTHRPESDADGAGGVSTLVFTPTRLGTADLVLGYVPPSGDAPTETFTVTVVVTDQ